MMLNYAIIGTNWLCALYADAIEAAGERLYAVCSRDLARAKGLARNGAKAFDSIEQLLKEQALDAVYLCLPNTLHVEATQKCLDAGKHVLCEKPVTTTAGEFEALCKIADGHNVKLAEAVMNFYSPATPVIRQLLKNEQIVSAHLDYSQRSSKLDFVKSGGMVSSFDKTLCGGALYDLGVYPLHFAAALFGAPEQVFAFAQQLRGVDVTDALVLRYAGFDVLVTASKAGQSRAGSEIICDGASYTLENVSVVLGAARETASGRTLIDCGSALPEKAPSNPSTLDGVQTRVVRRFSQWVRGDDGEGYLALRNNSLTVQRIMDEARCQTAF